MRVSFCLLIFICLFTAVARAEFSIRVEKFSDAALPIAVVPFGNKTGQMVPQDVSSIVTNDLTLSGDFKLLSVKRMLSLPDVSRKIHYRDWKRLGQKYILVGQIQRLNDSFEVTYELVDIFSQEILLTKKLSAKANGLRKVAHKISDAVYEVIMGAKGNFSTKVAYVTSKQLTKNKTEFRLWVADMDGHNAYTLFKSHKPILSPAWSNDGTRLAFSAYHSGKPALYIQGVRERFPVKITEFPGVNGAPDWAPDDRSLVITLSKDGDAELYRYYVDSKSLDQLTNNRNIIDTEGSWSPDGRSIAYTSNQGGKPQVYLLDVASGHSRRITFEGIYNARPRFSPDGKRIYRVKQNELCYSQTRERISSASPESIKQGGCYDRRGRPLSHLMPDQAGKFHIAMLDLERRFDVTLTNTPLDESPTISPNGRLIMYATKKDGKSVLSVVAVDGESQYFLPSTEGTVKEPAWSPILN